MKVLRVFHRFGCLGYTVLAMLLSIALLPLAYLIMKTGDQEEIATLSTAVLVLATAVAALVVVLRKTDLLMACAVWLPIYFVSYLSLIISLNTIGNGYRLTDNPAFRDWGTLFLCLAVYEVPVLAAQAVRSWRARTGWFEPKVARMKAGGKVQSLIRTLRSPNPESRTKAAAALSELADARSVEPLIAALGDEAPQVRRLAAEGLAKIGDRRATLPLAGLLADRDITVCGRAARALGDIGDRDAVEPLIAAAQSRNPFVSHDAITSLGKLGDARAVEPLIRIMKAGSDRERHLATQALAHVGDPRGLEAIHELLRYNPWLRKDLAYALAGSGAPLNPELRAWSAAIGSNWDLAVAEGAAGVAPLAARLFDQDRTAALAATGALTRIGGGEAVEALAGRMLSGEGVEVRQAAAGALTRIGGAQAVGPLLQALEKATEEQGGVKVSLLNVRCTAAEGLGLLGDRRAVPGLIAALQRQKDELRQTAAQALARITGQDLGDEATAWQAWWAQQP